MRTIITLFCVASAMLGATEVFAQDTAFSYQGQLQSNGVALTGSFDFVFALYNNSGTNSGQVGTAVTVPNVGVTNGLFIATLDFGNVFSGNSTWLSIQVRTNGGTNFTPLNPLQQLTPVPSSIYAETAGSVTNLSFAQFTNQISLSQLPPAVITNNESGIGLTGSFSGNGEGLTNVNAQSASGTLNSTNYTGLQTQPVARMQADFINGIVAAGLWNQTVSCAFFAQGLNPLINGSNYTDLVTYLTNGARIYGGVAVNYTQTNSGLISSNGNAYILCTDFSSFNGPVTVIVWFTGQGNNQNSLGPALGGIFNNAGWTGGMTGLGYSSATGPMGGAVFNGSTYIGIPGVSGSPNAEYYPSTQDWFFRCAAVTTDRTNIGLYVNGCFDKQFPWFATNYAMSGTTGVTYDTICIGARYDGGGAADVNFNGIIHGYCVINAYLSEAQVQFINELARNTGMIQIHRVYFGGDSLTSGGGTGGGYWYDTVTNWPFWGNCDYSDFAVAGSSLENQWSAFQTAGMTNAPNGLDLRLSTIYSLWWGHNSTGDDPASFIYSRLSNAISAAHQNGSIAIAAVDANTSFAGSNDYSTTNYIALVSLVRSNTAGADFIWDVDKLWTNLIGAQYWTNGTYFDLTSPPHNTPQGDYTLATNLLALLGTNILTPFNYNPSFSLATYLGSQISLQTASASIAAGTVTSANIQSDENGAAIKRLNEKLEQQNKEKDREIRELKQELDRMRTMIQSLSEKK